MSVLRFSDLVPKIACMLSPTISTPAAPSALSFFWSALPMSLTPTRRRVMQASRSLMLLRPPKARTSCWANRFAESSLASCTSTCSSSRPGVFMLKQPDQPGEDQEVEDEVDRSDDQHQPGFDAVRVEEHVVDAALGEGVAEPAAEQVHDGERGAVQEGVHHVQQRRDEQERELQRLGDAGEEGRQGRPRA